MSVKKHVMGWANRMLARACTTLLCHMVLRLFMSLFLQQDYKWRQLSFWRALHKLQRGDMFSLRTCILR